MGIVIKQKGDFSKVTKFLERAKELFHKGTLDEYGALGVEALTAYTPIRSGLTAASWRYSIEQSKGLAVLSFHNDNVNDGVNISIIVSEGHGTGTGGWVQGTNFIPDALDPLFEMIANAVWAEVTRN